MNISCWCLVRMYGNQRCTTNIFLLPFVFYFKFFFLLLHFSLPLSVVLSLPTSLAALAFRSNKRISSLFSNRSCSVRFNCDWYTKKKKHCMVLSHLPPTRIVKKSKEVEFHFYYRSIHFLWRGVNLWFLGSCNIPHHNFDQCYG